MKIWAVFIAVLLLAACDSTHSSPLPNSIDDPAMAEIGKNLDDDDRKLLAGYLMRREMAKAFGREGLADGVATVGDAIDAQRKWAENLSESERRAAELKAEVQAKRKAVADQISKIVTVAFIDSNFQPSSFESGRYDDYQSLTFAVQNTGSKKIKAVKGYGVFTDTFGDEFVKIPMKIEDEILPGEKKTIELGKDINQFMDEDKKIMRLDGSQNFKFEADHIVFTDGTSVEAPDQT